MTQPIASTRKRAPLAEGGLPRPLPWRFTDWAMI